MASKALRRQLVTVAFVKGLMEMIMDQEVKFCRQFPQTRTIDILEDEYKKILNEIDSSCGRAMAAIIKSSPNNNAINDREAKRIKLAIEQLKAQCFMSGKFSLMQAVSFNIALLVDQLAAINNASIKYIAFQTILGAFEKLEQKLDPDRTYQASDGFKAAVAFYAIDF